jgi:hypothetical protein
MIENINLSICQSRIQQGQPSFCINWLENGQQNYEFFQLRFIAEDFKNKLIAKQKDNEKN